MMESKTCLVVLAAVATVSLAFVKPALVRQNVAQGQTVSISKTITLDDIGSAGIPVDVCFVQDATGSIALNGLCEAISGSIEGITDLFGSTDARYGFKTFKDYPDGPDEVYRSRLSASVEGQLLGAYEQFCLEPPSGGGDFRDAQYDAIVRAVGPATGDCGWRQGATRIMIGVHDGGCKGPGFGSEYINSKDSVRAALIREEVLFIGITVGGLSTNCFQPFADATGGVIVEIGQFDELASSVGAALEEATFSITPQFSSQCDLLDISYNPPFPWLLQNGTSIEVTETITTLAAPPVFISCNVELPFAGLQRVRFDVQPASCGNGVVEDGEQCDEDSISCGSDCRCSIGFRFNRRMRNCVPLCGNNRVDRRADEECDGSPFCLDNCKCDVNFTPRRRVCRCIGGSVVMGECILS